MPAARIKKTESNTQRYALAVVSKLINFFCLAPKQRRKRAFLVAVGMLCMMTSQVSTAFAQEQTNSLKSGRTLFDKGEFEEALKLFDKSVDEQPTNSECHFWRAKCLQSMGRDKESAAEFKVTLLFADDESTKDACRAELKKASIDIPKGSVNDPDPKTFKLATRKLDWNLQTDTNLSTRLASQDALLAGTMRNQPAMLSGIESRRSNSLDAELANGPSHASFKLGAADLSTLKNSDVYIILDHSGSMSSRDCPSNSGAAQSRIDWATEELQGFAQSLEKSLPHGFTFIPFTTSPQMYSIRSARDFVGLLKNIKSAGGTSLEPALIAAFRLHYQHRNQPMLIAIVTDGQIDVADVAKTIAEGTRRFPLPNGLFITFAQIGINSGTRPRIQPGRLRSNLDRLAPFPDILDGLDAVTRLRETDRASYEPCIVVPFQQVRADGLARTILHALRVYVPQKSTAGEDGDKGKAASARAKKQEAKPKK